jgi:hypothetical protein
VLFHSAAKIERLRAEREAAGESLWTTQLTGAARTRLWQCVEVTMGDRRKEGTEIVRAITAERTDALFRLHIGRSVLMGQRRTGPWSVLENFFFTSASDDDADRNRDGPLCGQVRLQQGIRLQVCGVCVGGSI